MNLGTEGGYWKVADKIDGCPNWSELDQETTDKLRKLSETVEDILKDMSVLYG
jgi:hypothetical protein